MFHTPGMIEFRDALTDLLEEFGTEDGGFRGELPEGRHIRVDNKVSTSDNNPLFMHYIFLNVCVISFNLYIL